jgi:hypothetical protein
VLRASGSLHTEAIVLGQGRIKVYLLDSALKALSVQGASLSGEVAGKAGDVKLSCAPTPGDNFVCDLPYLQSFRAGDRIRLHASTPGADGTVEYELPMRPQAS